MVVDDVAATASILTIISEEPFGTVVLVEATVVSFPLIHYSLVYSDTPFSLFFLK